MSERVSSMTYKMDISSTLNGFPNKVNGGQAGNLITVNPDMINRKMLSFYLARFWSRYNDVGGHHTDTVLYQPHS